MLRSCIRLLRCKEMLGYTCVAKIHTNYARVLYFAYGKGLPNPELQTPLSKVQSCDSNLLMSQISTAKTLDNILEMFSNHQNVINAHHIVELLKRLHNCVKEQGLNPETLRENETFQAVCSHLLTEVETLDAQEVITVYKVLSSFGIRNNSYAMRSILKIIGKHHPNMNLEQVALLYNIISKQKHNALVDRLKLTLSLKLQGRIDRLLDSDDMCQVVNCLHLACHTRLQPVTVQKIVSSILKRAETLSPSNAVTVISTLVNITTPLDDYKQLLNMSFEVVTKTIESLDQDQVLSILKICREKKFCRDTFFFEVAKKVVSERWNLKVTQEVLKFFNDMKFRSDELKDYLNCV